MLFCTVSCSRRLSGIYMPLQNRSSNNSSLQLHSDSTFSYTLFSELQKDTFIGKWHVIRDTLVLKTISPINDDSLLKAEMVVSKRNPSIGSGKNKIKILVQDSIPFTVAKVFVNNDQVAIGLNNHGEAIVDANLDQIRIQYQGIRPRIFAVNSAKDNDFTIFLYDKAFVPLNYLSPIRKWIIKGRNLLPLNGRDISIQNKLQRE